MRYGLYLDEAVGFEPTNVSNWIQSPVPLAARQHLNIVYLILKELYLDVSQELESCYSPIAGMLYHVKLTDKCDVWSPRSGSN